MRNHLAALSALALLTTAALAGCSGSSSSDDFDVSSIKVDDALVARLPADIASSKKLVVGTDASYAPIDMLAEDGKTIKGFDIDLLNAVMAKFGVKVEYQNAQFDSIIAGVDGKKYNVGASAFTIRKDRLEKVSMVSYFNAGNRWAVQKGNPKGLAPDSMCGAIVAVQTGTYQDTDTIPALQKECGDKLMTVQQYTGQDEVASAVATGKADAFIADSPVTDYAVKNTGDKLEGLGDMFDEAPYGFVLPKDQAEFGEAMAMALRALNDDGTYDKILDKWGLESGKITDFAVNPNV